MRSPEIGQESGGSVAPDVELLIQGYSSYLAALKKSPRTVGEYTADVTRWAKWWKRPIEYFHQDEWDDYAAHLHESGVAGRSVRRYQTSLKRFFKYLRRRKVCQNDPAKDCESVGIDKALPSFLLEPEMDLVLSKVDSPRYRAMLELCYSCGLRNEECRELKLSQVQETYIQLYGKGAKERVVTLLPASRKILNVWLKEHPGDSDLVFPSIHGKVIQQTVLKEALDRALKAAGILKPLTVHGLRHSIATHLAMRKVPVEEIKVFMGHERIETTMLYIHLAKQLHQEALLKAHPRNC